MEQPMSTTDKNPPQSEQKREAAGSPLKKPETETARAHAKDVERAASGAEAGLGHAKGTGEQRAPEPERDARPEEQHIEGTPGAGDPVQCAHPRGTDVVNDEGPDSTVDTDGKDAAAKRKGQYIQAIVSQATLVNAVPTSDEGLGGFDSRAGGELPVMALRDGYELVDRGVVPAAEQPRPIFTSTMSDESLVARDAAARGESYAAHRLRPERLIEIRLRQSAKH
jgi:Protein of unknown function (DUF3005)